MASKFVEYKPNDLSRMGCYVGGLLQAKLKTSAKLKEALQVICGNLPQGPIDKVVKDFSNKATGGWCCWLELVVNTSNICFDNEIPAFDYYLTVLFQRCYQIGVVAGTFLIAKKLVGGHVKKICNFVVF